MPGRMTVWILATLLLVELKASTHRPSIILVVATAHSIRKKAHAPMINQQARIRQALQESMSSIAQTSRLRPFEPLYRAVFVHALQIMSVEWNGTYYSHIVRSRLCLQRLGTVAQLQKLTNVNAAINEGPLSP